MVVDDHPDKACYYIQEKNHLDEIAAIYRYERNPCDTLADARLIAAAPELLEALEELFHLVDDAHDGERVFTWDMQGRCRAAIAKAKGEE
jgi:hypothetical protein